MKQQAKMYYSETQKAEKARCGRGGGKAGRCTKLPSCSTEGTRPYTEFLPSPVASVRRSVADQIVITPAGVEMLGQQRSL